MEELKNKFMVYGAVPATEEDKFTRWRRGAGGERERCEPVGSRS